MTSTTAWIGIDVSAEGLTIARGVAPQWNIETIPNTTSAINEWIESLGAPNVRVVLEATGTYSAKLIHALHAHGVYFSVITPKQASQFAGVLKNITKNDERDACCLCLFGQHMRPPRYEMPAEAVESLRQMRMLLSQLKKQRHALRNQQHALLQLPHPLPCVLGALGQTLLFIEHQIQDLENQICSLSEQAFEGLLSRIITVKGIGPKTALALLVATDGLRHFSNVKQLAKFVGLAPAQRQSGTSVFKAHINRAADPELRKLFYLATWSACKSNIACIELRKKLKNKGKPPKVILIAVAHKLLRQIWGVLKNDTPFDNDFAIKSVA